MSSTILKTIKHIPQDQLENIIEKAYGLSRNDFQIEYGKDKKASIHVESQNDKGAGMSVEIVNNSMGAFLSLYPPLNYGGNLDSKSVEELLLDERKLEPDIVKWDLYKECFQKYMEGCIIYRVCICEGIEAVNGKDATLELHFELGDKKPKELEDGRVDFKDINNIVMVKEGDKLLTYFPETEGIDGKRVTGDVIPAKKGKKITVHKGNGVEYDDETGLYTATMDGHVTFKGNRINVNPVYSVRGDVDYSEGNIDFNGTVTVSGDVLSGFSINAKNISVWGIVKDATLTAKEDITVRTGIVSSGKCKITAGNTVTSNFIEGAEIYAGVSIVIKNHCYNSKLYSEGDIIAASGDGVLNGGEFHAFSEIRAKQIGMPNSSSFALHVGVKHFLNERIDNLINQKERIEKSLQETDKKIRVMAKSIPDLKKKEQLKEIIAARSTLYKKYEGIDSEIEKLIKTSMHPMPFVRADNEANEGIKIFIYNTEYVIPEKTGPAKFIFHQNTGNIVMVKPGQELEYNARKR